VSIINARNLALPGNKRVFFRNLCNMGQMQSNYDKVVLGQPFLQIYRYIIEIHETVATLNAKTVFTVVKNIHGRNLRSSERLLTADI